MLPFDPKKPLYGFRAKCPHAWRQVHLFMDTDHRCILFRLKNAPKDWCGALLGAHYAIHPKRVRIEFWTLYRVVPLLKESCFFRILHLSDPRVGETRVWRILWRPDFGYVVPLEHPKLLAGAFFWSQKPHRKISLWKTPTQILKNHFECEWYDAKSDVREALNWCDLPEIERRWRGLKWLCGGQQELEAVTHAAYLCEPNWPHKQNLSAHWFFRPEEKPSIGVCGFHSSQRFIRWDLDDGHRITRLAQLLSERNQAVVNQPIGTRLDWDKSWERNQPIGNAYNTTNTKVQMEPPTQHHRLEAALFLRDWLTQNAPDLLSDWFPNTA